MFSAHYNQSNMNTWEKWFPGKLLTSLNKKICRPESFLIHTSTKWSETCSERDVMVNIVKSLLEAILFLLRGVDY